MTFHSARLWYAPCSLHMLQFLHGMFQNAHHTHMAGSLETPRIPLCNDHSVGLPLQGDTHTDLRPDHSIPKLNLEGHTHILKRKKWGCEGFL